MADSKKTQSEMEKPKQITLEDLRHVSGGRMATGGLMATVKAGGKGSINGEPVEFPVDEW